MMSAVLNPTFIKKQRSKLLNLLLVQLQITWENGFPITPHKDNDFLKQLFHDVQVIVCCKQNLHHLIHDLSIVVVSLLW